MEAKADATALQATAASGEKPNDSSDLDLSRPLDTTRGLRRGLTAYGDAHFSLFLRKVFIKAMGFSEDALSRPIVGIVNTHSSFNPCHANVPQLMDAVRRGVQLAGGLALDFPTISLHESFAAPTSMFLRNLMSMDTEEMIRAQPVDAVVLIGGCDKTVPAQLMGAISANKPAVHLVTGPMIPGSFRGARIGACTDCRSNWARYRAGEMDIEDIAALNEELAPTAGTCGVMGTASTMACLLVALGMMPLDGATPAAVSAARLRIAEKTGGLAVKLIESNLTPQTVLTRASFLNAMTVLQAFGGSTNAAIHLLAIANRHPALATPSPATDSAPPISLATLDAIGRRTPLLVDLKPSGTGYMADLHAAGGMPALLHQLRALDLLHLSAATVSGEPLGAALDAHRARPFPQRIIAPANEPLRPAASIVVLRGNLCPGGALLKASAVGDARLLRHAGPAVVFAGTEDLARRLDEPALRPEITADSVLVLTGIGPRGFPGMPEAGLVPIPRALAAAGVRDMLRVSDGRISGTAGGTVVVHVSPEAGVEASVLGVVRDGDVVRMDVEERVLKVEISDEEIAERLRVKRAAEQREGRAGVGLGSGEGERGYRGLYLREVNQAEEGADFRFLTAAGPGTGV